MTHASPRPRPLRMLALAGAVGLAVSPLGAALAFAEGDVPGTFSILEPGSGQKVEGTPPHLDGCALDLRLEGLEAGQYTVTFQTREGSDAWDPITTTPNPLTIAADGQEATTSYTIVPNGKDTEFKLRVNLTVNEADVAPGAQSLVATKDLDLTCAPTQVTRKDVVNVATGDKPEPEQSSPAPEPETTTAPETSEGSEPSAAPAPPTKVDSGLSGGASGLVALGVGGTAIGGLAVLGARKRRAG